MKKILLCGLLAACGGGSKSTQPAAPVPVANQAPAETPAAAPKSDTEVALDKMVEFTNEMCACKDAGCAQKVSDEMTTWSQEMANSNKEPPKMTEADQKRAVEIGTRMGNCMQTAMSAGPGPTP